MTTNDLDSSSTPSISSSNSIINSTIAITASRNANIPENYQIILLSFAYGIISLLAVVGNASIIYIVIRNRHMHSVTNYFICNLALADCLVACFAIPFQVNYFSNWLNRKDIEDKFNLFDLIDFRFVRLVSSRCSTEMGFTEIPL